MKLATILLAAGLAISACSTASPARSVDLARAEPVPESEQQQGMTTTRFVGPGIACGIGFAIALQPGERLTRFDRMMDFVTYELEGTGRAAVIYEGNAPQEADMLVETGRDFPSVVALHFGDNGYDKSLAGRILTKSKVPRACLAKSAS